MKTHFLFIALLMIFPSINAQFMPVVTPSPEAASLGSIAKCPVDYHTGQVNVEIPLLEVEQSGFKLPIKLIYDTSGLLINNRATWVGTNWTLDAGGIITRTVKGEADENGDKRFWKFGNKLDHPQWNDYSYLRTVFQGETNMCSLEPDEFNFKIPGISGTFYVGNDQKAHVVGRPDIKVEMSNRISNAISNYCGSWMYINITDPNGIIYHFQETKTETCKINNSSSSPGISTTVGFHTTWLLHSITLPTNEKILQFNYSEEYTDATSIYQEIYSTSSYKYKNGIWSRLSNGSYKFFVGDRIFMIGHRYLESIEGNNFKIDFIRSEQAKGILDAKWCQLKKIILSRKPDNKQIKEIQLNYDNSDAQKRFWLSSIHVYGQNNVTAFPPYLFDYYPHDERLANYGNNTYIDFWGYYKGTSGRLIPDIIRDMNDLYYSPERNPNTSTAIQGMLKQITYPTGGLLKITYESNDYSKYGETRISTDIQLRNVKKSITESSQLIDSKINIGGGLRVKELSYWDKNKRVTTYRYTYSLNYNPYRVSTPEDRKNILSSGILGKIPIYHYKIDLNKEQAINVGYDLIYHETKASEPFTEMSLTHGALIGYSEVTEAHYNSKNAISGFIKYKYSNFDTYPDLLPEGLCTVIDACFSALTNRSMDRGILLSKEIYDKSFNLMKKHDYNYLHPHSHNIKAVQLTNAGVEGISAMSVIAPYYVPLDSPDLIQETETTYEGNASSGLKKVTKYLYNDRKQVKEIQTQMNDGQSWHHKRFQYPTDYPGDVVYSNMIGKNMISPIIQNEEFMIGSKNDISYISKEKYNYVQIADKDENMIPVIGNYQSSKGTDDIETHITYDYYDKKGNPLLVTINDKENIIYLWGYNYQYIVAEIRNASMDEVNGIIDDIDEFEKADTPDTSKFYELRTTLKNALIRTFIFDPLIGKIKETDAKGVSTYFEYNQQNRLKYTRDYLGNIMEGYLYNYSNINQQ